MKACIGTNGFGRMGRLGLPAGWYIQTQGLEGCLWWSTGFVLMAGLFSFGLPEVRAEADEQSLSRV